MGFKATFTFANPQPGPPGKGSLGRWHLHRAQGGVEALSVGLLNILSQ